MMIKRTNKHQTYLASLIFIFLAQEALGQETWGGLLVAPEFRCSEYDKKRDYPYSQSLEDDLKAQFGGVVFGPYTGRTFDNDKQTDIEHIIATSEAHDSGLCAQPVQVRKAFASDLLNLTLAGSKLNRHQKSDKDAADWLPERNKCWFANRVWQVRTKYQLTIDQQEAAALEAVISQCETFDLDTTIIGHVADQERQKPAPMRYSDKPLRDYDTNGNGRITCSEARAAGIAPVKKENPAYVYMNDRDGDGIVCE